MSPTARPADGPIPAGARAAYWEALSSGDSGEAIAVALELTAAGVPLLDVLDGLVSAGQVRVGRLWAANEWNVAREHRATSVSEQVVAALTAGVRADGSPNRGRAVVTCCDGEWHALPSRVVATALLADGWDVQYLGASVPVAHLAQFMQDVGPDVTALSCSVPTALPRARQMIEASRQMGVPVIVGGRGFGPGGRWGMTLGANGTAADARSAGSVLSSADWPAYTDVAPPVREPDRAAELLWRHRRALVDSAERELTGRWPAMASYDRGQRARAEEDLGYLVDFLASALYVDDVELYTDFVIWLGDLLQARYVPRAALTAGIEAVTEAVAQTLGAQPRAQRFLAEAALVSRPGSP